MKTTVRRVHVLHAPGGRVLAVTPAVERAAGDVRTGARPLPVPGQLACEVELTEEQAKLPLEELLALEVHADAAVGQPRLRSRAPPGSP